MISNDIRELLNREAARINNPAFIDEDPVQFPRRFEDIRDIEIISFLSSMIAWGNRKIICRDIERLLKWMDYQPYSYMMDKGYEEFDPLQNIHRTFFGRDLQYFLKGLRKIYKKYDSLDSFSKQEKIGENEAPAWELIKAMQNIISDENNGEKNSRCLPSNLNMSALKRVNMALRWLVRDDGIVDLGVWKSIPKKKLFIPLDVHVGNVSRQLGLLSRKANDRKSVEELTEKLKTINPEDPAIYDFALFGLGVESKNKKFLNQ